MKFTCTHLEDFEWGVAQRQMYLFRSRPSFHLIHALSDGHYGRRLVCGVYNTELNKGVLFLTPLDYANWVDAEKPDFAVFKAETGDELYLLDVGDGGGQPTNAPA